MPDEHISELPAKTDAPASADQVVLADSVDAATKRMTIGTLLAAERGRLGVLEADALPHIETNDLPFNLQLGQHYTVDAGSELYHLDEYNNLRLGKNLLVDDYAPANFHGQLPDFVFFQNQLRLGVRNITIGELDDPSDINGRRAGPQGGYPFAAPDNGDGTPDDLTGIASDTSVFQLRGTAFLVPYGGDEDTPGARDVEAGALIGFKTAEMARRLTPDGNDNDIALGMNLTFALARIGRKTRQEMLRLNSEGNLLIGERAINAGDNGARVQVRGEVGADAKQTLTPGGTWTGGTLKLELYPPFAHDAFPVGDVTAAIGHDATAADVKNALEALAEIGVGELTATGGPFPTNPITIEFTGAAVAKTHFVRLGVDVTGLTGTSPTLAVAHTVEGLAGTGDKKMITVRHGGVSGSTPTGDYFDFQAPDGTSVLRLEGSGDLRVLKNLRHVGTQLTFFNGSLASKPTVTGAKGGNAALASVIAALAAVNLIADSSSA